MQLFRFLPQVRLLRGHTLPAEMESLSNQFSVISLVLGHTKIDPGRQFKNDGALPVGQGRFQLACKIPDGLAANSSLFAGEPAGVGDIDDHVVGPRPLHLEVARGTGRHGVHPFSSGDGPAFGLFQPVASFV